MIVVLHRIHGEDDYVEVDHVTVLPGLIHYFRGTETTTLFPSVYYAAQTPVPCWYDPEKQVLYKDVSICE